MKFSSTVLIKAPPEIIWKFLTEPDLIKLWEEDYISTTFLPTSKDQKIVTRNYYKNKDTSEKIHTIQKTLDISTNEFILDQTKSKNFSSTTKTVLKTFGKQTKLTTFIDITFENIVASILRFLLIQQILSEQAKKYHKLKNIIEKTI